MPVWVSAVVFSVAVLADTPRSVGLVLSGGGAKGIAHIGVIQALEDEGIPVDYVTGTSMGAIVGGLYASGYSPEEMMELIRSRGFAYWSTGRIDENLVYYFAKEEPTPAMLNINMAKRKGPPVPSSLISPLPMNFAFMQIFASYTAQCGGDFDRLFVPFRCVASDVSGKHKVVFGSGSLGDAVRASMSFPIVFQPIEVDSVLMYDGGIYDNFPVDVMTADFNPSIMIGVDVSTAEPHPSQDIVNQLENMIIQNNDYDMPADRGIKIHIDLNEFSLLDFQKAREIYRIGYDRAMEMMDSIRGRVGVSRPADEVDRRRAGFKSRTPEIRFRSVTTTGGTPDQNDYITYLFSRGEEADTFGIEHARDAFYRAITPGRLRDLKPHAVFDRDGGMFDLHLKASVKNNLRFSVGGYITSAINSMVFLSTGYNSLSFRSVEANVNAWIGQSYMAAAANTGLHLRSGTPSSLTLQGVVSRQKFYENDRLFYEDNMPTFVTAQEAFVRLAYGVAAGRHGKVQVSAGYGAVDDRYYNKDRASAWGGDKDRCTYSLGQAVARFDYNTLDNLSYPVSGAMLSARLSGYAGRYHFYPHDPSMTEDSGPTQWYRAELSMAKYFGITDRFALGAEVNLLMSNRKLTGDYNAAIVAASAFNPTPASYNSFNPAFRANSYATAGVVPVWKMAEMLQLRGTFHAFVPWRRILATGTGGAVYGERMSGAEFFGELAAVYTFPFASLSVYGNYMSYPARNWNCGVAFGLFFLAPGFMK